MDRQVKSKKRVAEHGEVFTAEREVNAMLDLVKSETERVDSRFLEPACGDGNFLAEILRRKLIAAKKLASPTPSAKPVPVEYEKQSVIAVTSIYGVELLADNTQACVDRLYEIWDDEYAKICKGEESEDVRNSVRYILEKNILCGNALTLKKVDEKGSDTEEPIVFAEWSFISGSLVKRKDYRLDVLLRDNPDDEMYEMQYSLLGEASDIGSWMIDPVTNQTIPKPLKEYPATDYRRIWEHGK